MMETITVNGQNFTLVGTTTRRGKVIRKTYFASDRSHVKIDIDYTYTKDN